MNGCSRRGMYRLHAQELELDVSAVAGFVLAEANAEASPPAGAWVAAVPGGALSRLVLSRLWKNFWSTWCSFCCDPPPPGAAP